jgi:hypothetical protein
MTTRRVLLLALAVEAAVLLWIAGRWVYLRLLLSDSLGIAARVLLCGVGITVVLSAAYFLWTTARRNRFRFGLRTMFIAVAVFAVLLAVLTPKIEGVVALNRALGVVNAHSGNCIAALNDPDWKTVQMVGAVLTDEEFAALTALQDTVGLNLPNCNASPNGWRQIVRFKKLKLLIIKGTNIDDDSLNEIRAALPLCVISSF